MTKLAKTAAVGAVGISVPALVLAIGIPFAEKWEGKVNTAHWDRYAEIWDICYGNTRVDGRPVQKGDTATDAECRELLITEWTKAYVEMVTTYPLLATAPPGVQAMATDLDYNAGLGNIKAAPGTNRALATGNWRAFCEILPQWRKSNGQFVPGLLNRRNDAVPKCLASVVEE
ncbi:lysozyme [Rhodobacter lacus]|uniref:Lysozyme n=1 Tax=Rhodobacter lacus TaxID=1641972 RepID=A0ABW5ADR1_9RHOB